jgi:exodeoxyribonuclease V alpha subunit
LKDGYIFISAAQFEEQIDFLQELLEFKIDITDWLRQDYQSFDLSLAAAVPPSDKPSQNEPPQNQPKEEPQNQPKEKPQEKPQEKPLALKNGKIYFQKFFHYQQQVLGFFQRNHTCPKISDEPSASKELDKTQRLALAAMLHYPVSVVSGGPGTGKTFLIGKFLEELQKKTPQKKQTFKVALLSFTGKAVRRIKEQLPIDTMESVFSNCYFKENIFLNVSTIHSLLKNKKSYYYNEEKEQFLWDWVIIDETSMVDLALIYKLLKSLPENTKTIFIGDSYQLNPIDAGYFFFDICSALRISQPSYFITLKTRHRFEQESENQVLKLVEDLFFQEEEKAEFDKQALVFFENKADFYQKLLSSTKSHWLALCEAADPMQAWKIYNRFVILCALNISDFGVIMIQNWITKQLEHLGKKEQNQIYYHGRPILIQTNSPSLGVYNGDVGICLKNKQGNYKVYFKENQNFFSLSCEDLPQHQSAYALSIHKSQGSEFEEVLICLPEVYNEILNRELLYTAITRAKKKVSILTQAQVLQQTLQSRYQETTDLKEQFLKEF